MDEMALLRRAGSELERRLADVTPDQLSRPTPCAEWTVRGPTATLPSPERCLQNPRDGEVIHGAEAFRRRPIEMQNGGSGGFVWSPQRAVLAWALRPAFSRLSKITLLARMKTSNRTNPMRSRTSPNDAIRPPRPKA
jgi:hypothetical protein